MALRKEDLPAPFGPATAIILAGGREQEEGLRAIMRLYATERSWTSSAGKVCEMGSEEF